MLPALIDTDVLSEVFKRKRRGLLRAAEQYVREHGCLTFSAITLYEIERGLLAKRATRLLSRFQAIVRTSDVLPVTIPVLERAAQIWADAQSLGAAQNDADLIIAATALEHGLSLVTGNRRHFNRIAGLHLDSWDRTIRDEP